MENNSLKNILDDEFLGTLAKSADLYKIGTNSVLDPEEIRIGLKVVPRAVMAMLVSELIPMEINSYKDIQLPFGKVAFIRVNKNAPDDFTGSVYSDNKLVYDFKNRSIPGLGIILLSTFELYDMEELNKPHKHEEDIDRKVQKLIDERMELHSLVNRVVEDKMAQREAVHKIMMNKLNEAMKAPVLPAINHAKMAEPAIVVPKAIEIKPEDITKKEAAPKKGSPLKAFIERKKKPKEYLVQKCETTDCSDCGQTIFGSGGYSGCICYGENQNSKLFLNKNEKGELSIRFSRNWSPENIEMLLDALRKNNGKH
jgi:hypothetical protein